MCVKYIYAFIYRYVQKIQSTLFVFMSVLTNWIYQIYIPLSIIITGNIFHFTFTRARSLQLGRVHLVTVGRVHSNRGDFTWGEIAVG